MRRPPHGQRSTSAPAPDPAQQRRPVEAARAQLEGGRRERERLLFSQWPPTRGPPRRRAGHEANYGLRIGNFELDYADSDLRYKSSLHFEGVPLTSPLINAALVPAVQTMDRYLPGLMAVLYGGKTPLEAIREVEG